ncbi:hypothetical protein EYF80_044624 [Liparis tanakae]|uniref:Uncharacterized protein n=1 Tax=Liparis tanakae TaxID=230148 RepID=A0A4Z2FXA7_9TELE|nr:hypothetical protein EYF80_044624 [Liparis tanakae]
MPDEDVVGVGSERKVVRVKVEVLVWLHVTRMVSIGVLPHFCMTFVLRGGTRWRFFDGISPHYKLFETQAQFVVVTEELRVRWDLIQEDLGHLQWALQRGGGRQRNKERESKNKREEGKREGGKRGSVRECI